MMRKPSAAGCTQQLSADPMAFVGGCPVHGFHRPDDRAVPIPECPTHTGYVCVPSHPLPMVVTLADGSERTYDEHDLRHAVVDVRRSGEPSRAQLIAALEAALPYVELRRDCIDAIVEDGRPVDADVVRSYGEIERDLAAVRSALGRPVSP